MDPLFFDISAECRRFTFQKEHFNIDAFKTLLTKWERELKKSSDHGHELVEVHYSELARTKQTLLEMAETFHDVRGFYDRIFKNMLSMEHYVSTLSVIFSGFIKGITFFTYQKVDPLDVPVYHRIFACGTGDDAFRQANASQCMQKEMRRDVRKRIETCYIERLIYDDMYRHQTLHFPAPVSGYDENTHNIIQDKGHLFRLDLTKTDFKTCFPNLDIEIDMEYDGMWPIALIITRSIRGRVSSVETYVKNTEFLSMQSGIKRYASFVDCTKKTENAMYVAVNRFEMPGVWKKV